MRKLAGAQTRCLPFQDSARQRSGMRIRGVASHGLLSQTKLRNDPYSGLPWYGVLHDREHRPHVRAGIDRPIMAAAAPNSTMLTWELGLMLALTAPPSARAPCPRGSWEIVEGTILGGNSSTMPRWELGLTGKAGLVWRNAVRASRGPQVGPAGAQVGPAEAHVGPQVGLGTHHPELPFIISHLISANPLALVRFPRRASDL